MGGDIYNCANSQSAKSALNVPIYSPKCIVGYAQMSINFNSTGIALYSSQCGSTWNIADH